MRRRLARGRLAWGAAITAVALVLGAAGVVPASADPAETIPLSVPGMPVSLAQAGELTVWGGNEYGQSTVPASLAGVAVSQVVLPAAATLALAADGRVVGWGGSPDRLHQVPAEVAEAKVAQIAAADRFAGAVTRDGRVLVWGKKSALGSPLDVPAGLSGVKQLAISSVAAIALKTDGSVVAWGRNYAGMLDVPAGLKATAIAASTSRFFALTEQGTVVQWGTPGNQMPNALSEPGNVKAIASAGNSALALLADNTLAGFGGAIATPAMPEEITDVEPVLLASGGSADDFAIVDRDRNTHHWAAFYGMYENPVPELNGRDFTQIALANNDNAVNPGSGPVQRGGAVIVAKLLRAELPQVAGAASVGGTLTATPGTFSASPDAVTSQWLVDGAPVAGNGSQLAVTAAMVGKSVAYRSTATKAGQTTVTSTSAAVTVTKPAPPPVVKVASKTKVAKVTVAKKAATVTVAGKVTASKSPAGKAKVTIKKGKKTIVVKTVGVSAKGAVKLAVKKFNKLVAKKLKAKGKKAKTAYRGKYTVSIQYLGNTLVKASTGNGKFTVKK
ncbi:hypothetical protein GCM10023350_50280 [Nocardioides endophyticus]|uniref:Bacterial Ig domain-containing protein n=1 Tax=Nocardioides endophyticus TaxID=1353775 RepID=A0ABP8ZJH2_9ACTN